MKIRQGFVSNSSASSFIVRIKDDNMFNIRGEGWLSSKEDIKKLEEYGFKKCNILSPFTMNDMIKTGEPGDDHYLSMKYWVSCNQDEVICFLVKNNIPFKASVHYDNEYWSLRKDSKYILSAKNFGITLDMYGEDRSDLEEMRKQSSLKKIPVEEYIKVNELLEDYDG